MTQYAIAQRQRRTNKWNVAASTYHPVGFRHHAIPLLKIVPIERSQLKLIRVRDEQAMVLQRVELRRWIKKRREVRSDGK
jgi:hypothetical protein